MNSGYGLSQLAEGGRIRLEQPKRQIELLWTVTLLKALSLFRHFAPRVKGFLMKSGASEQLAEECAQDVMATLWQKAGQFDPTRASVATWASSASEPSRCCSGTRATA